jgi:uncharacterized membrane protein YagU involved in acid resistance
MARTKPKPDPVRGLAAGLAAGLIASWAMDLFQAAAAKLVTPPKGTPATVKAADMASRAATGDPLPEADKDNAGQIVHYLFGAALGAGYGLLAEYRPRATAGFGTAFAMGSATLFDEIAVPAAGLGKPPTEAPLSSHANSYASHAVFGVVTEAVRRALRGERGRT